MLEIRAHSFREFNTNNRGSLLSARIYPSERINKCDCGGNFSTYQEINGIKYPVCSLCRKPPKLLRIRAKVTTEDFQTRNIDIRYDQSGKRLNDIINCLALLKQIELEMLMGNFDVKRFESKKSRDQYLFQNVLKKFLDEIDNRYKVGDVKFYTQKNYHKYGRALLKLISGIDISAINSDLADKIRFDPKIAKTTRDQSLNLLRTIMNWAHKKGIIRTVPGLGEMNPTNTRKNIVDIETARIYVSKIQNPIIREAANVAVDYAIRPNEIRALQIWDVNLEKDLLIVKRSFSGPILSGDYERKSTKRGGIGSLEFPLSVRLKNFVIEQMSKRNLAADSREPIFSLNGNYLGEDDIASEWRKTLKKENIPHFDFYEIRGARISEIYTLSGDVVLASEFGGHTNTVITQKRYIRKSRDKSQFIDTAKKTN